MADFHGMDFEDLIKKGDFRKKLEEDFQRVFKDVIFNGSSTYTSTNESTIKAEDLFKKWDTIKPKKFSQETTRLASNPYFYTYVATRLSVPRDVAKRLVHGRLYGMMPCEIANIIKTHTNLSEVRKACEDYLN